MEPAEIAQAARRNLILLAAGMAGLYGMIELVFGAASLTFEQTGGSKRLVGVAPAIFLLAAAAAALLAGRQMDRAGRRPVLMAGFSAGLAGCLLAAFGVSREALAPVLLGFALAGASAGTVLLSRAAAADMFPSERRPRAIAQVLFGAVFGALLAPLAFSPLLGSGADTSALALAWLGGAGFMAGGLLAVARLKPDPGEIAVALGDGDRAERSAGDRSLTLAQVSRLPGVPPALLAVLASWAGMVALMSLSAPALLDHGHEHGSVFPVLAAHFVGMFAFFAVVGRVIERLGRPRAIAGGLLLLAGSGLAVIATIDSVHLTAVALLGVGLGWSLSFVGASAELSDRAPEAQRGTVIGLADLLSNTTGAALVVAGGVALDAIGIAAVAVGAGVLPLLAAALVIRAAPPAAPSAPAAAGRA